MKNDLDKEKIYTYVAVFFILIFILGVVYMVYTSNSDLSLNSNQNNETNQNITSKENNNNSKTPSSSISDEEKDKMNVSPEDVKPTPQPAITETQIATYTTNIYDKDENRVANITLANQKLNNFVVKAGETFSFNTVIGPMGVDQGFKEALGFDTKGNKIKMPGGGLCQISSTLYNAALISNLEIVERHPHSRRVYYVPKDKDATIYYGSLDFKFKNTSGSDIKITASNDNTSVTITLVKLSI